MAGSFTKSDARQHSEQSGKGVDRIFHCIDFSRGAVVISIRWRRKKWEQLIREEETLLKN
jgi:hypothetical protein